MKGIRARIFRDDSNNDGSNGGISSCCNEVTIIDSRLPERDEPTAQAPAVRIVERSFGGKPYVHLEPIDRPEGKLGPMMGGNYVGGYGELREFANGGAIPLHDRFETQAEYDRYSA